MLCERVVFEERLEYQLSQHVLGQHLNRLFLSYRRIDRRPQTLDKICKRLNYIDILYNVVDTFYLSFGNPVDPHISALFWHTGHSAARANSPKECQQFFSLYHLPSPPNWDSVHEGYWVDSSCSAQSY